ncbi:MAG: fibrobacter succinogenes major paralogous domain-containing protein [Fibrobacter sp.]|nr:fibrobacter succinogenes major paralogous domain-containing protein [Fibrobacter sp.]
MSSLFFIACGGDSGSNSVEKGTKDVIALADGSGEKVCDEKLDGWVAEAVGKDFRRCLDGEWTKISTKEASAEEEIIGGATLFLSSSSTKSSSSAVSSSSATSSSSFVSSSSVKSSSSAASSSSVASSSSAKSSSSAESSSSVESSSSIEKLVWQYLNPAISYGEIIDDRDGQVYKTVEIGSQTWMAENLNYDYNNRTARSYCYADSCSKYGRLYTWSATVDSAAVFSTAGKGCGCHASSSPRGIVRGVCPVGWHVPSVSEFQTLISYVGGYSVAGANLKSTSGWKSNSEYVGNGSDSYGFSALPAGARDDAITYHVYRFYNVGEFASFWTTSKGSCVADRLRLGWADDSSNLTNSLSDDVDRGDMDSARSVRCLKD